MTNFTTLKTIDLEKTGIRKLSISDILEILGDVPQSEGLHVYMGKGAITTIPFPYPYRSDNFSVMLILSGTMKLQLDLISHTANPNDLIIISPRTINHILEIGGNLELIAVSFTLDFARQSNRNKNEIDAFEFFASKAIPKLTFSEEECRNFIFLARLLMQENIEKNHEPYSDEVLHHTFSLLMYIVASRYKKENSGLKPELSRQEELTLKFLKLLDTHFKQQRSVQFYADSLCVTSGHLTKILKEVSGKTAGELIEEALLLEARILLSDPMLTIAQIADELRFSDQSSFGKSFKKNIGLSPTEYRRKNRR
ncbi:MAG: AraC family transcriptional regulator [Flavobacteriaceae bacterium]|jgi:AraC family transcriptional activator of pobA|uniref:helix-turn-helix domain-containing protein n=1 Tax=Flavobacterium sp. Leaf359 TaxID=1736351 RepID=UPI0009EC57E1|nr:AraC family transcriptional regulator [Flavobacterium sp. Leaf359]PZO32180.1 MAG: AraC family transcriptional regulator [Flavobacteriaceae bacterium]PZQ79751.1 MAG: AraC family transcriptional regulator [Flavobacterium johnsoniae]